MSVTDPLPPQKRAVRMRARAVLFIVQVTLPFILYLTLKWSNPLPAGLVAALFVLSMLYLVWLG